MFNHVELIGHVGAEPKARTTPSGVNVCDFSLAVNRIWYDANGTKQEKVLWVKVVCWEKVAELAVKHLTRGRPIMVIGELMAPESWIAADGKAQSRNLLNCSKLQFLPTNERSQESGQTQQAAPPPARQAQGDSGTRQQNQRQQATPARRPAAPAASTMPPPIPVDQLSDPGEGNFDLF